MSQSLSALRSAGFAVDSLPEEQQGVLSELSDEEIRVLTSIQDRLQASGPDVEGYAAMADDNGGLFW